MKYSCQVSRKIIERAQMKRKGMKIYHKTLNIGKGLINCGKLGSKGLSCGKKGERSQNCPLSQCCFGKAALHNYENFRKSSVPARVMYFWSGAWNDFSPLAFNSMRDAFSAGMPSVEVEIDGSPYLVDFLRMLQVDLRAGCQRSIAWIDKNGSCFFPKFVLEDNFDEEEEASRKFEVEIEIRISPTEASNTKRCGVVGKKGPEISEVSKSKKDWHPRNMEASKTQNLGLSINLESMSKKDCHPRNIEVFKNHNLGLTMNLEPMSELSKTKKDWHLRNTEASKTQNLGLSMNLEIMSNVPTSKPGIKVACMNDLKAYQLTDNSSSLSTKALAPKRVQIPSDEVGNSAPKPGTKVACMNDPKAYQLTDNSSSLSTKALAPKRVQIPSDEVGNSAPKCTSQSESKQSSNSVVAPVFEHLGDKLIKLRVWDGEFVAVQNKFLDGLKKIRHATTITGIYRNSHASALGQARLQAFHKQIGITRNSRGNANVKYAWHGTSDIGVSTVITHGFSCTRVSENGPSYGVGVYLAPEDCSFLSVLLSTVDKNDEQHVVLCRVITGNVEEVPRGSRQFHPSCEKFDTGVDDLITPKYHIVWSTHMNTHILPEYVISFKAPHLFHGLCGELKANTVPFDFFKSLKYQHAQAADQRSVCEPVPSKESVGIAGLANMSFLKLLSIIRKHLPPASINSLEHLYTEYKVGRIGKDIFIRRVRMIAGDKLLISVIRGLRGQAKITRMPKIPQNCQQDIGGSERLNPNAEFTTFTNQKDLVQIGRVEPAAQTFLSLKRQNTEYQFAKMMDKSVLDLQSSSKHEFVLDSQSIHCKNEFSSKMSGQM